MSEKCSHCKGTGIEPTNILRTLRGNRGQKEVSDYLGITQSAYSRLESGSGFFYHKHLPRLADFYGVSLNVILGREPIPTAKPARAKKDPPKGAVAASRRHREALAIRQRAKAKKRHRG